MGVELKLVLLARNLTFNSNAAPDYVKDRSISVKHHGETETQLIKTTVMKQRKGLNDDLKPEHKKAINRTTMQATYISSEHKRDI